MLDNIRMCNEAAIIKIALSWKKSWQTIEASQMSRNRYVYTHIYDSNLKATSKISGE